MRSNVTRLACFLTLYSPILAATDAAKVELQPKSAVLQLKAELNDFIGRHASSPIPCGLAKQVLAGLPDYQEQLNRAFTQADDRLHLDIILVSHGVLTPDSRVSVNQSELVSQKAAAEILETTKSELIGFEGAPGDNLTFAGLADSIMAANLQLGRFLTLQQAQQMVISWTGHDGALLYYRAHPEARLTGMEETPVYLLQILLQQAKLAGDLQYSLNRLRSELGLAKAITQLRKNSLSRGAIVVGWTHEDDYRQVLAQLPISCMFYQTTPATQTVADSRYLQK